MRIGRKHLRILVVSLSVLIVSLGTSSVLYSDSAFYEPTLDEIATAKEFHLSTTNTLKLPSPPDEQGISGNLFSFSHVLPEPDVGVSAPGVFDSGMIVQWESSNRTKHRGQGIISGSFIIDKHWGDSLEYGGQILISFTGRLSYVPPYEDEEEEEGTYGNYNFSGSFKITSGSEYYAGLSGTGTITGTYQHHDYGEYVDFVMTGKAFAR
jgi:hypothetical protein